MILNFRHPMKATSNHLRDRDSVTGGIGRPTNAACGAKAFSLIELLVVIVIIGLLAAIGLPAMRGFAEGTAIRTADRQLLDDLAFARQYAIANRATVYMVFVPLNISLISTNSMDRGTQSLTTNLYGRQFAAYNIYSERTVGDQPGRSHPRYLKSWQNLPDGVLVATNEFEPLNRSAWLARNDNLNAFPQANRPLFTNQFRFPTARGVLWTLPCIGFDSQGRLVHDAQDEFLYLTRGRVFNQQDAQGRPTGRIANVVETPAGNWTNNYNRIRIDWFTGRARVEQLEAGQPPPGG
jgi:prepilin-type N-terminal cleavage/methylation domain-containing protein